MGSWDYKLFDDDSACDIRDDYRERIIMGMNDDAAESLVISEFEMCKEENYMLWLPLAVTEWRIGRLSDKVRKNALKAVKMELSEISEIWEPEYVDKRKKEIIKYSNIITGEMCKKKKLRMPPYAFKFPWRPGSVLQYKISYHAEDNIYHDKYVLLLVTGVSKTMPFKIPCESTSFSLYGWCGEKEPSQQLDVILNESPGLIDLYSPYSRINKAYVTHTVLWNKSSIKLYDIKCISEMPLPGTEFNITEPGSPLNATFEDVICYSLKLHEIDIK